MDRFRYLQVNRLYTIHMNRIYYMRLYVLQLLLKTLLNSAVDMVLCRHLYEYNERLYLN